MSARWMPLASWRDGLEPDELTAEAAADPIDRDLDEADDWTNSGLNFGEEPRSEEYFDPWGCYHIWADIRESIHDNEIEAIRRFCWQTIQIQNDEAGLSMLTWQICHAAASRNCINSMGTNNTSGELNNAEENCWTALCLFILGIIVGY